MADGFSVGSYLPTPFSSLFALFETLRAEILMFARFGVP